MSAFKTLFTDLVNNGGDFNRLSKDLTKQMLKVFVKETSPYFLISDGYFFVPAYFTRAALDEFEKKFSNIKVAQLNERVVLISNWSLELRRVDSNAVFTSYNGLEVRLIVHSFKPNLSEQVHPKRWPSNLYRDSEFKGTIQAFRHRCVQAAADKVAANDTPLSCKNIADSVIAGKDDWNFKDGNTAVISIGGGRKAVAAGGVARVKAGAKGKAKAAAKAVAKKGNVASKVANFAPKKAAAKGKQSTTGKRPASVGGKKSAVGTTDRMNMQTLKKFLKSQAAKKGKKSAGK